MVTGLLIEMVSRHLRDSEPRVRSVSWQSDDLVDIWFEEPGSDLKIGSPLSDAIDELRIGLPQIAEVVFVAKYWRPRPEVDQKTGELQDITTRAHPEGWKVLFDGYEHLQILDDKSRVVHESSTKSGMVQEFCRVHKALDHMLTINETLRIRIAQQCAKLTQQCAKLTEKGMTERNTKAPVRIDPSIQQAVFEKLAKADSRIKYVSWMDACNANVHYPELDEAGCPTRIVIGGGSDVGRAILDLGPKYPVLRDVKFWVYLDVDDGG